MSDYARLKILYDNGGVYFDTDVEAIRNMDDVINSGAWMAVEKHASTPNAEDQVAVGLGFAVEPHDSIIKEVMEYYENTHYVFPDGHMEQIPIVPIVTKVLRKHGMPAHIDKPTKVAGDYYLSLGVLLPYRVYEFQYGTYGSYLYHSSLFCNVDVMV